MIQYNINIHSYIYFINSLDWYDKKVENIDKSLYIYIIKWESLHS